MRYLGGEMFEGGAMWKSAVVRSFFEREGLAQGL